MNDVDEDGEDLTKKAPKQKKKKFSKKKGRILEKADFKNDKDYELFLRDLEQLATNSKYYQRTFHSYEPQSKS